MFGPNFILMLLMFGGEGGFINTMLTLGMKYYEIIHIGFAIFGNLCFPQAASHGEDFCQVAKDGNTKPLPSSSNPVTKNVTVSGSFKHYGHIHTRVWLEIMDHQI